MKKGEKILLGVIALLVLFTIAGGVAMEWVRQHSDKPMFPILTHFDFSGDGLHGFDLYRQSNCNSCHRAVGSGTSMGVSLDGLGSKHDAAYFYSFLKEPDKTFAALGTRTMDHGKPPKDAAYVSSLPDADLHAIAVFLSQLKSDQGSSSSYQPPKGDSGFIDAMLDMWVPDMWRGQYKDIRVKDTTNEKEVAHDAATK
jgi:cytochrome c553